MKLTIDGFDGQIESSRPGATAREVLALAKELCLAGYAVRLDGRPVQLWDNGASQWLTWADVTTGQAIGE